MEPYNEMNPESGTTYMYREYQEKFGFNTNEIDEMLNIISYVESGDRNIEQDVSGHGKGYFQMESKTASGAFQTGLQRYVNITGYKPEWVKGAKKHDDARNLTREQQSEITLASIFHDLGSDNRLKSLKNKDPNAIRELWLNNWWKDTNKKKKEDGTYETDKELKIRLDNKRDWFDDRLQEYNKEKSGPSFMNEVIERILEKDVFE